MVRLPWVRACVFRGRCALKVFVLYVYSGVHCRDCVDGLLCRCGESGIALSLPEVWEAVFRKVVVLQQCCAEVRSLWIAEICRPDRLRRNQIALALRVKLLQSQVTDSEQQVRPRSGVATLAIAWPNDRDWESAVKPRLFCAD